MKKIILLLTILWLAPSISYALPLSIIQGGTGQSTSTKGDLLVGSSTYQYSILPIGTTGQILTVTAGIPAWVASSTIGINNFFSNSGATTTLSTGTVLAAPTLNITGNANVGGGISTGTWIDPVNDYNCAGVLSTTTGSITTGTNSLVVASASGWRAGMGVTIALASTTVDDFTTTISSIAGTTFTLAGNAGRTVSGAVVRHDDTACLQNAFNSGKNIHIRAGNYNITGAMNINNSIVIEGEGVVGRRNQSTGFALTNLIQNASTTNTFNINIGYVQMSNFSVQQASTTQATNGYAFNIVSSGSVNDRQYNLHDLLVYGTSGGLSIGTTTLGASVSSGQFSNLFMSVASSSVNNCIYYNNPAPAGDNRFHDIDCRVQLLGNTSSAPGIRIAAADVTGWENIKALNYSPNVLIDASAANVAYQRFVNSSFENSASSTTGAITIKGNPSFTVNGISIVGSEFGVGNAPVTGVTIGPNVQDVLVSSSQFNSLTNGIDLTNAYSTSTVQIVGNNANFVTNYIVNPNNVPVLLIDTGTSTFIGNVGIGTTTQNAKLSVAGTGSTAAPSLVVSNNGNVGVGTTTPGYQLSVVTGTSAGGLFVGAAPATVNAAVNITGSTAAFFRANIARNSSATDAVGNPTLPAADMLMNMATAGGGATSFRSFPAGSTTAGTTTMTLLGNGQVGIGISAPTTILQVVGSTLAQSTAMIQNTSASASNYPQLMLGTSGTGGITTIGASIQGIRTNAVSSGDTDLVFAPGAGTVQVERMRLLANGAIGIATTSPWRTLSVVGTMAVDGLTSATSKNSVCIDSVTKQFVDAGGTTCITSSLKTKHDIDDISSIEAYNALMKLRPVSFTYNDGGDRRIGFIAEEVNKVEPRLVDLAHEDINFTKSSGIIKKGEPVTVEYGNVTALLVKAFQTQNGKIDIAKKSAEDNWQWMVIGLMFVWIVRLEFKKRK